MAASKAKVAKGTKIGYRDAGTAGVYTYIAEITEANIPELTADTVEVTNQDSGSAVQKIFTGWKAWSDFAVTLNYHKTAETALYAIAGVEKDLVIEKPDGSKYAGKGGISKLGGTLPLKDAMKTSATFTPTDEWTFTAGA